MGLCNAIGNIFRLIIVLGCALGLCCQLAASANCEFVSVSGGATDGSTWGIFFRGVDGTCEDEAYDTDDGLITGARTCLIISMCAGFIAGCMVMFEWLCCKVPCAGVLEGLGFLLAWVTNTCVYMLYGTDLCTDNNTECDWTTASSLVLVATICYLGCGILLCFAPQPDPICCGGD